jgi:hypothetical protein
VGSSPDWFIASPPAVLTGMAYGQKSPSITKQDASRPLEVRVTKPLAWNNHCLQVNIARVNRSKSAIFLPFTGVFIYSSVTDATNALAQGKGRAWFTAYGYSDIIAKDVTRLGPGEAKRDVYWASDTFPVVNGETRRRRQVRVQGSLPSSAGYFPEAPTWQISKAQREEMMSTPPAKWKNADRWNGGRVTLEIPLPCSHDANVAECTSPPPIFAGERGVRVPDLGE